jgi:predicted DsbA family dithiol-disulfide isomerase
MARCTTCAALAFPDEALAGSLGTELRQEVSVVQRLAPGLPIALPPGKPNTRLAIERAIGLLSRDRARGMDYVRKIYRAFWAEGRDISDPHVLRDLTEESVEQESNDHIRRIAQEWETAWHATGQAGVPLILSSDGGLLVGFVPVEEVKQFFD